MVGLQQDAVENVDAATAAVWNGQATKLIEAVSVEDVTSCDTLIIVGPNFDLNQTSTAFARCLQASDVSTKITKSLEMVKRADAASAKSLFVTPLDLGGNAELKMAIFSPTGALLNDWDDVRSYESAAETGISRAIEAGSTSPCIIVTEPQFKDFHGTEFKTAVMNKYENAQLLAGMGALKACYVPLEVRERLASKSSADAWRKLTAVKMLVDCDKSKDSSHVKGVSVVSLAQVLETARSISRDIGGSDPERMAPPRVEEYVRRLFAHVNKECDCGTKVDVKVVSGQSRFEKEYPCFAAVNRAASHLPRHDGRILFLTPAEEHDDDQDKTETTTLMLVGKGVTYDTGGADIKAGGIMAGMSRDKCGAADVAAIVYGLTKLQAMVAPSDGQKRVKRLRVMGAMAMVRNSVGHDSYVSDEIIVSRAGVPLRVGNTDAEGRMAMVDVLCRMREMALSIKSGSSVWPCGDIQLMTIATLTGHQALAHGPYTAIMDNGPASISYFAQSVQSVGAAFGDPFEMSTVRREDFDLVRDKSGKFVDVLQCNNAASSRTPRGHQFPAAFLQRVSGLDMHGSDAERPLRYSHLDVAGSSGDLPGLTTASSVVALVMHAMQKLASKSA